MFSKGRWVKFPFTAREIAAQLVTTLRLVGELTSRSPVRRNTGPVVGSAITNSIRGASDQPAAMSSA